MVVVMGRRGFVVVVVGGRRHEGEDGVQGEGADEGEAVDVPEVHLAAEEEEGAEEEEEEDGAGEVGVVHDVLGDGREGVEDCKCLTSRQRFVENIMPIPFLGVEQVPLGGMELTETYLPLNMPEIHP